jgi:signal transduction histidine kinase
MDAQTESGGLPGAGAEAAEACHDPQASLAVRHLLNDEPADVRMVAPLRDTVRSLCDELQSCTHRLNEADARKDVFLATLSHELRNPLAPIRIAAQLLLSANVQPNELKIARAIIARQVAHLSSLLDDLLDVSRITRGAFVLKRELADLQGLLDAAIEAVRPEMDAKRHTLRLEPQTLPLRIEVDPVRITQVITNLLTNATKYTKSGGLIVLSTRLNAQHLIIAVRDNGMGIAPDALDKVFDMFTRIEPSETPAEGGLGIGLALVKGLMTLHGGRITVHSAGRGQGSEFAVYLPRSLIVESTVQPSEPRTEAAGQTLPRRILIADDNADGAETMKLLLASSGHEVHVAHTGAEALEIARRVQPDVALLDIGMPDMSGYEVAQSIRHEAWGKGMTLIAATGWGQQSDKRRALAAGFDQHLTKPIDPTKLGTLLERR